MSEAITGEQQSSAELDLRARTSRFAKKVGAVAAASAFSFLGGAVSMNSLGQSTEAIGPVDLKVGLKIDFSPYPSLAGGSVLEGNVLGEASAATHQIGPQIVAEPTNVNVSRIENTVMGIGGMSATAGQGLETLSSRALNDLEDLQDKKKLIAARSIAAFAGGTLLAQLMLRGRRRFTKEQVSAAGIASATLAGSTLVGMHDFEQRAFLEPSLHGAAAELKPYAMSVAQLDALDQNAMKTIDGFWAFQSIINQQVERQENIPPTALKIMTVADIHGRNVYPMLKEFIAANDIDAVVDLGDLTDWGTIQEVSFATGEDDLVRELSSGIEDLGVPYVFMPGNHDSAITERAIAKLKNTASVKKGGVRTVNIDGLRLVIAGDPLFTPDKSYNGSEFNEQLEDQLQTTIDEHLDAMADSGKPADWLATHEPSALEDLDEYVPGTSNGHLHVYGLKFDEKTSRWQHQEGSTGGSGLRMAQPTEDQEGMPTPDKQQFSVMHFGADCQMIKTEHFSYDLFGDRDSEYFVRLNPHLEEQGDARCGDIEEKPEQSPQETDPHATVIAGKE